VVAHPEAVAHDGGKANVDTSSVARSRRGRKVTTNLGRYRSLERRYWAGVLTASEEESFERIVYMMSRLHKEIRA
jgi:hypothetical protein